MMSTSALRPCLLVVSLIGLIGGGTCGFPRVKDTLEDACNDIRSLDSARTAATQMLAGPEDALPVLEIATEHPSMKGGASDGNNHLTSEAMQTMDLSVLSPDTLMNLSRIDLAMRILEWENMKLISISMRTRALRFGIEINFSAFASKIANKLVELHENTGKIKLKTKIHNSKILIDTLNYLEKNMPIGSALELDHQPPSELQKIKRIIEAYEYFSGAMNSVYSKYVRIVQAEALKSFKKHGITDYNPNFSYLTQVDQQHVVKPSGNDHRDIGFSTIRRTKVILHELKQVKESDRRSLKQLQSDKKKVEEILGYAEWY
ncbi:hypothetical protein PSTT_17061, partial [Puccinia striiformis]